MNNLKTFWLISTVSILLSACGGGGGGGGNGNDGSSDSNNADLSALGISAGSLNEAFDADVTDYTAEVSIAAGSTTVTATAADSNIAALTVNGDAVTSGSESDPITLTVGNNSIAVIVTAEDGSTTKAYNIDITALADNANLNSLSLSAAPLNESFDPAQTAYTADVDNGTDATTVTFMPEDGDVTSADVNGDSVSAGSASNAINLAEGDNTISVTVTAADGSTTNTYEITVTRAPLINNHTAETVVFRADKETDERYELYSVIDDGSASPVNLSGALPPDGDVHNFAVSPDGTRVAFIANKVDSDINDLFIVPIDGSDDPTWVSNMLTTHTPQTKSFAWSPDGSQILFLADLDTPNADELYIANADGAGLEKINGTISTVVEIGDYAWSPDGSYVAYKVYNRNQPEQVIGVNSHVVGTVSGDPGYSVRLNPSLVAGGSIKDFAWSSNSTNVAYLADQETDGEDRLYIGTANVSQISTEISHDLGANNSVTSFSWSFDGTFLAYLAEGATTNALYTSTADAITKGQLVSQSLADDIDTFQWSPVANQLVYMGGTGEAYELFLSSADGGNVGMPISAPLVNAGDTRSGSVMSFAWSPDGGRVAYRADQETADVYELFLSAADRSFIGDRISGAMIASGDVLDYAWSPDSNRLAYRAAGETPGLVALYVSTADGATIGQQVSTSTVPEHADIGVYKYAWASDGEALTYRAAQTTPGVVELYASLANGHIRGTSLSGALVADGDVPIADSITELFADGSWIVPFKNSDMCAMDYDAVNDAIFIVKCVQARSNKILRYSFATKALNQVYELDSQLDYGARIIDGDLFIAGTYREAISHLTDLDQPRLTEVGNYFEGEREAALNEIRDIAVVDDDIYFVTGNFLTSENHDGIQRIAAPNYDTVTEILSEADAGWPELGTQNRSILSTGSGANAELVVTTGPNGNLERRDIDGNLLISIPGYGGYLLQKDAQDNIYTVYTNLTNSSVTYWDSDLSNEVVVPFNSSLNTGSYSIIVIREEQSKLIAYITSFRSLDPRLEEIVLID